MNEPGNELDDDEELDEGEIAAEKQAYDDYFNDNAGNGIDQEKDNDQYEENLGEDFEVHMYLPYRTVTTR
jgi:hypothetical protein